jgi:hypothetical protein
VAQSEDQVYVWIGETRAAERLEFGSVATVGLGSQDEDLYDADPPDSWDKGGSVGTVTLTYFETPSGEMANVHATFDLRDLEGLEPGDSLVGHGALSIENGMPIRGHLAITGGTGRFRGARGQADVDHRNPHKYRVSVST